MTITIFIQIVQIYLLKKPQTSSIWDFYSTEHSSKHNSFEPTFFFKKEIILNYIKWLIQMLMQSTKALSVKLCFNINFAILPISIFLV